MTDQETPKDQGPVVNLGSPDELSQLQINVRNTLAQEKATKSTAVTTATVPTARI